MLKKVQECQRRKDSKSFKLYNSFLIDSWFGWVVNQEGYGMVDLSTDWIVCSINVGASESDGDLVFCIWTEFGIKRCFGFTLISYKLRLTNRGGWNNLQKRNWLKTIFGFCVSPPKQMGFNKIGKLGRHFFAPYFQKLRDNWIKTAWNFWNPPQNK